MSSIFDLLNRIFGIWELAKNAFDAINNRMALAP